MKNQGIIIITEFVLYSFQINLRFYKNKTQQFLNLIEYLVGKLYCNTTLIIILTKNIIFYYNNYIIMMYNFNMMYSLSYSL